MNVALTGHRPQRLGLPDDERCDEWIYIGNWLNTILLDKFIHNEHTDIYCGMASGSDIKLGLIASEMRWMGEDISLHCILPCKNYNSSHPYYKEIKDAANEWIELSDEFYKGCDNIRDQYMVDHCDVLLAIWDGNKSGGVWSTIRKAQKAGKKIIYCPKEIVEGE